MRPSIGSSNVAEEVIAVVALVLEADQDKLVSTEVTFPQLVNLPDQMNNSQMRPTLAKTQPTTYTCDQRYNRASKCSISI